VAEHNSEPKQSALDKLTASMLPKQSALDKLTASMLPKQSALDKLTASMLPNDAFVAKLTASRSFPAEQFAILSTFIAEDVSSAAESLSDRERSGDQTEGVSDWLRSLRPSCSSQPRSSARVDEHRAACG